MKILGIGNAIVDVICKVNENFIEQNFLNESAFFSANLKSPSLIFFNDNKQYAWLFFGSNKIIYQLIGGLKSSMGYLGCSNVKSLRKKPKFITITKAGFYESMVHNIDLVKG